MDQDASNKDANDQSPPIAHRSPIEKPEGADAAMDQVTTPEEEMNVDLLPPLRTEATENALRKEIRMEIPDSEEASMVSSPVKVAGEEDEKRDEAAEHGGRIQTVREVTEQEAGQEDTPTGQQKLMRTETPDREEATEFSSPVKVGIEDGASHDGAVQVDGGLETPGEVQEQHVEEGDTTMMDVSGPVQEEGIAEASRAADGAGVDVAKMSVIGMTESAEATKDMVYTTERDHGLPSTVSKEGDVGHGILQGGAQDAQSVSSLGLDTTKNLDRGTLSAAVNGGVIGPQTTPIKGVAGAMEAPVNPNAQGSLDSPGTVAKEIAIAARKIIADQISPTILDTSEIAEKPKLLNTIRAIPDSDDDEDFKLPDAPSIQERITRVPASNPSPARDTPPTITKPAVTEEKLPKAVETSAPGPKLGTAQQGEEKEVVASAPSCKEKSPEPDGPASAETPPSPAKRFKFKAPALYRPTPSVDMRSKNDLDDFSTNAFPLGAEDQLSPQPPSSPPAAQLPNEPTVKSSEQATVSIMEESSQTTDIASSPLKPLQGGSIKAKRRESPTGSSTAPEAPQSKDVLMAELKAIKIASIQSRISALETEISTKRRKLEEATKDLKQPPAETVKRHIKLLHDYNDIRDVGQGLVGMIADNRGVRIGELYEEFGVGLND